MADNQFGKYELLGRLAAGGMAEIFRARYAAAAGISKQVVIKRILPHYAENKQFIAMFTNEARIVMGLSHGNIAQVFDFGEIDGDWFIAMEYVDGQPLSKIIKRARTVGIQAIPTTFAVLISIEMLRGLHYAHTRLDDEGKPLKIVHRDVSPQNVLVSYEGQVKLVDFGIAKARTAGNDETEGGAVKGKYSYFSPEQARGKELDARSDVFAAGIVLYEMLCGGLPFQGRMIDTMSRIVKGQLTPPRESNPDIPPELETILLTALENDREKRYPTADAFQAALSSYLNQTAPSFQASTLGALVQFLFEAELVNESRPVQLSREFLDQVPSWKKPLPAQAALEAFAEAETAWGKDPAKLTRKLSFGTPSPPTGAAQPVLERSRSRLVLLALIPLLAILAGAGGVVAYGRSGTFTVELSSTPTGAAISVDGESQNSATPAKLELSTAAAHTIALTAPGMNAWSKMVTRARGESLTLHAELESNAPPPPVEEVDAGVPAAPEPPGPDAEHLATAPTPSFEMAATTHALLLPKSRAARIKLNPARTYRVTAEGKASLGELAVKDCGFFVEGSTAKDSFGVLTHAPVTVHGTMLYAFFVDADPGDNTGALNVRLRDNKGGNDTLPVSAKDNAITPAADERMTYDGLNPALTYDVTVRAGSSPVHTHGKSGPPVTRVLVSRLSATPDDGLHVLEVGKTTHVTGTPYLWFTFPDDDATDNDGSLIIEISPGHEGKTPNHSPKN